jgi:hypothetical protein
MKDNPVVFCPDRWIQHCYTHYTYYTHYTCYSWQKPKADGGFATLIQLIQLLHLIQLIHLAWDWHPAHWRLDVLPDRFCIRTYLFNTDELLYGVIGLSRFLIYRCLYTFANAKLEATKSYRKRLCEHYYSE